MGQVIGNFAQSGSYKAQATIARAQGRAARTSAYRSASNLEEEARADSHLAAKNMMRQRENQTEAVAAVRAVAAATGFTSEGSGKQSALATADIFETAIRDAALSNAISDSNKRYAAATARHQGDMAQLQSTLEAQQYEQLAKNARTAGWVQLGSTAVAAGSAGLENLITDTPAQIPIKDGLGNPILGADGKPLMTANPDYLSPTAAGKSTYDLTGFSLTAMPGTVNTANTNKSGSYIYELLTGILGEKTTAKHP